MKESLKRFIGDREVKYCRTSSFTGDAEELEEFLVEIQKQSQEILASKYRKLALPVVENTESYLITTLNSSQLSESELNEQEEKLHKQMSTLESKFSNEQEDFELEVSECVEEIKNDVRQALEGEETTFVVMALNGQDIKEKLNTVVRNAVTVSVKKRFIPKVEKYLKRVSKVLSNESLGDIQISFTFDTDKLGKGIISPIVAVVAGLLLGTPIIGVIAGIFIKLHSDKKREEAKQEIRRKLQMEVYPQVLTQVDNGIEQTITKQIGLINTSISDELKNQKEILEQAMADVRNRLNDEKTRKENLVIDIKNDLERIGEIKNGLR